MNDEYQRCMECGFEFEYVDIGFPLCLECAGSKFEISQLRSLLPGLSKIKAKSWIKAGFSAQEAVACIKLNLTQQVALQLRRDGVVTYKFLEYSEWTNRMSFDEVFRWSAAGFEPEDGEFVFKLISRGVSPEVGATFLEILGRGNLPLISLLDGAGIPINTQTLQRWKGLDLEVVTPDVLLALIDRGFPSGKHSVGFEILECDFEEIAKVVEELELSSPQEILEYISVEEFSYVLSLADIGFSIEDAWQWVIRGFSDTEALEWSKVINDQSFAVEWAILGFEPQQAGHWCSVGVGDPQAAVSWWSLGFSPFEVGKWRDVGMGPVEAAKWSEFGVSPLIARRRSDQGIEPS